MKSILTGFLAICCISATLLADIYGSLSITKEEAKNDLLNCMGEGWFMTHDNHSLVEKARSLEPSERVEGVRQLIQLAREYSESEAFAKDYKKWRNKKLNPESKSKLGVPRLGKMLEKKIDNRLDKGDNEKKYPSDPKDMIKKRLEDFLTLSATVDFDATLNSGRMFSNPEYEKKDPAWKMCYRAGKDVVEAAREEAQKWLDDLNK